MDETRVAGLSWAQTLLILDQIEREVEAELREQIQMGRLSDKAKLLTDEITTRQKSLESDMDAMLANLTQVLPKKQTEAIGKAQALVTELGTTVDDIEASVAHISNSLGNSEGDGEKAAAPDPTKQPSKS